MAMATVIAASTTISTLYAPARSPWVRAKSSSALTANSCGARPIVGTRTITASTATRTRSRTPIVVSEPNRYWARAAGPWPAMPDISTPVASPP